MDPSMATGLAADLPDKLQAEIRDIPGITSIETLRFVHARTADNTVVLVARDFPDNQPLDLDIEATNPDQIRGLLEQGEVIVGSVLAQQEKWKVDNDIELSLGGQTRRFRIAAIANDYEAGGLTVYMERNLAKRLFGVDGIDAYLLKVNHARLDEVKNRLQTLCDRNGVLLQSFSDIQHSIDTMMSGVVAGLWGLVVLGLFAAAFGIANTLAIAVLEQTREFGLLRIIGMTRWQIRKSILAQALIMGLLALVPGMTAGIGIAYLLHRVTLPVTGHPVPFGLHLWLQAAGFTAGLLVVMLAAWLPAERAARLQLCAAIRAD
jgi:putative ABC transport system permease protein